MHWNLVKLRVIVHSVLDRGVHNMLVGTIQEQKEAEARRSGTVLKWAGSKCRRQVPEIVLWNVPDTWWLSIRLPLLPFLPPQFQSRVDNGRYMWNKHNADLHRLDFYLFQNTRIYFRNWNVGRCSWNCSGCVCCIPYRDVHVNPLKMKLTWIIFEVLVHTAQ